MNNLNEDKVLCSQLVHTFPKDMIDKVAHILNVINEKVQGVYGIKVMDDSYKLAFKINEKYKLLFGYNNSKILSMYFFTNSDMPLLSVEKVDSEKKVSFIKEVINQVIDKDNLIDNNHTK